MPTDEAVETYKAALEDGKFWKRLKFMQIRTNLAFCIEEFVGAQRPQGDKRLYRMYLYSNGEYLPLGGAGDEMRFQPIFFNDDTYAFGEGGHGFGDTEFMAKYFNFLDAVAKWGQK